jgi:pyrroloquinoline quinone biosynthesis protein E
VERALTRARLAEFRDAGLDHVQLSIQDADTAPADAVAGRRAHEHKLVVAGVVKDLGLPLTVNAVLHRGNVSRLLGIAELGARLGADRLELAHTQFYGWALRNQQALLLTREQVRRADRDAELAMARFGGEIEIVYVRADYYSPRPKPCNYGWGTRQLVVTPNGDTLPCPAWPRRSCPGSTCRPFVTTRCRRFGTSRRPSPSSAARNGFPSHVRAARSRRSTSAAAGARPTS